MSLRKPSHLTQADFRAKVEAIGLPNTHVADMLGISVASMHRYFHGLAVIPKTVGLLVQLLSPDKRQPSLGLEIDKLPASSGNRLRLH